MNKGTITENIIKTIVKAAIIITIIYGGYALVFGVDEAVDSRFTIGVGIATGMIVSMLPAKYDPLLLIWNYIKPQKIQQKDKET